MGKQLPIVSIAGTEFVFDIEQIVLAEKANPNNRIYFHSMKDCRSHYEFLYSRETKNIHYANPISENRLFGHERSLGIDGTPIVVKVPSIGEIDPVGMCRKYNCTLRDIKHKTDFEIIVDQDIFTKRIDGYPVTIDLPGKKFEIDVANNLLRPHDGVGECVYLNAMYPYYSVEKDVFYLFYNTDESKFENPFQDGRWQRHPGRIVVEVPRLFELDPMGSNFTYGNRASYGLIYADLKMNHAARIIPWEEHDVAIRNGMHPAFVNSAYQAKKRELPTWNIAGTDFIVDVAKFELRETRNEINVVSLRDMEEWAGGYTFNYSKERRAVCNIADGDSIAVDIPEFVRLDPVGMAGKYGLTVDEVRSKSDFDLMVDQHAYELRVDKGKLPTIDIAGHTFYVDIRLDKLRPKDDFLSEGIIFKKIDHYYSDEANAYIIPYNPKTHEFEELNYDRLKEFPKHLIAVQFPFQKELDPIGWNRLGGRDLTADLKRIVLKEHFTAKIVPWQQTFLPQIIRINQERAKSEQKRITSVKVRPDPRTNNRRKM